MDQNVGTTKHGWKMSEYLVLKNMKLSPPRPIVLLDPRQSYPHVLVVLFCCACRVFYRAAAVA